MMGPIIVLMCISIYILKYPSISQKFRMLTGLTLFQLDRDNFYHRNSIQGTVYHVTKPSWNRVKANFSLKTNLDLKLNLHCFSRTQITCSRVPNGKRTSWTSWISQLCSQKGDLMWSSFLKVGYKGKFGFRYFKI